MHIPSITFPFVRIESSESTWEKSQDWTGAPLIFTGRERTDIITTNTPTILSIHTEVDTGNKLGPTGESRVLPQPTPGHDLLNQIISRIGDPQPGAQPTSEPATQTGFENPQRPTPSIPSLPGISVISGVGPTLVIGSPITLDSGSTLTLTNGLSTTIGTSSEATFIALTTNTAGYTVVVVSSSGTAVTATVSTAPVTITLPGTGFLDPTITEGARPGTLDNFVGAATTTSSKAGAVETGRRDARLAVLLGLVGAVVL